MTNLWMLWNNFVTKIEERREEGQGLVEYALIIVLVAIAIITVLGLMGTEISEVFSSIASELDTSP